MNVHFAYLLGLISANSCFSVNNKELTIDLVRSVVNKNTSYEGYYHIPEVSNYKISQINAHKRDTEKIVENIKELIKLNNSDDEISYKQIGKIHFRIHIGFKENSKIFNEIKKYNLKIEQSHNRVIPFIPEKIINSNENKIILAFLRGYCDIRSRISGSDSIYHLDNNGNKVFYNLRIGISLSHNSPELLDIFKNLFQKIGIIKGLSISKPESRPIREFLIRIDVKYIPYNLFSTHWRRIFLSDMKKFIETNKIS